MVKTNIIQNGSVGHGAVGWVGADPGNGLANRSGDTDGNCGLTTVMRQQITVGCAMTTEPTVRTASIEDAVRRWRERP